MSKPPDNFSDLLRRGLSGVAFALEPLVRELNAYGETEAAAWLPTIDADTHAKISVRAHQIPGMLDEAICLAAIEVFEGSPRALRRKRRAYSAPGGK